MHYTYIHVGLTEGCFLLEGDEGWMPHWLMSKYTVVENRFSLEKCLHLYRHLLLGKPKSKLELHCPVLMYEHYVVMVLSMHVHTHIHN